MRQISCVPSGTMSRLESVPAARNQNPVAALTSTPLVCIPEDLREYWLTITQTATPSDALHQDDSASLTGVFHQPEPSRNPLSDRIPTFYSAKGNCRSVSFLPFSPLSYYLPRQRQVGACREAHLPLLQGQPGTNI